MPNLTKAELLLITQAMFYYLNHDCGYGAMVHPATVSHEVQKYNELINKINETFKGEQ
jgi:hypothetical protein